MPENNSFRKKYLLPVVYCGVVAMAMWSASGMMAVVKPQNGRAVSPFENIEPAAGAEILPAKVSESDLVGVTELPSIPADTELNKAPAEKDAGAPTEDLPPLRISSDKPEVITLDRDAVNVLVGSDETLRAVPDTNRTIVLIPKKPGATYFRAIDGEGKTIMQRHVIVGSPEKGSQYIRIRRACAADDAKCKEYSVYYCPDMCHEVNVVQGDAARAGNNMAPDVAPSVNVNQDNTQQGGEYVEPPVPTPAPAAQEFLFFKSSIGKT